MNDSPSGGGGSFRSRVVNWMESRGNPFLLVGGVFFIYAIPLILLFWLMAGTGFFGFPNEANKQLAALIVPVLRADAFEVVRDITGLILVPLMTAYAAPKVD